MGTVRGILNTMQPSLDQLLQIIRTLAHDDDFVRVVLASTQDNTQPDTQGNVKFIEVSDGPEFRTDLQQALRDGLTALGLLGWEFKDGTLQAKGGLFPWHDESLRVFSCLSCASAKLSHRFPSINKRVQSLTVRVSEEGMDRVQETLGKLRVSQARSLVCCPRNSCC